jgi:hypothetical protein
MKEYTSLELSKRLYKKGFRAKSKHVWAYGRIIPKHYATTNHFKVDADALTFTELWSVVPHKIINGKYHIEILKVYDGKTTTIGYINNEGKNFMMNFFHESPAEAIGLLVEWLIDEGHLQCDLKGRD